jgi:hypothetical protein
MPAPIVPAPAIPSLKGAYVMRVGLAVFSWVMIAIFVAFLAGIVLLGVYSPRSGADVLDWRPTRSPDAEGRDEAEDIAQMLAASNALRRRRGAPERTEDEVADAVHADQREYRRRRAELARPDGETDYPGRFARPDGETDDGA